MKIENAINAALSGQAILFAGSGFSHGAKNIFNKPFPVGNGLRDTIADGCGASKDRPLATVAQFYTLNQGEDKLIELLKKEFSVLHTESWHQTVLSIPWKRIYTTNYDSVIEIAARKNGIALTTIVPSMRIESNSIDNICVHLNGHIDFLNRDTINSEFKLMDTSYSCESLEGGEWFELFKSDLQIANAIIVIGYSMQFDLDIKRLLSSPKIKDKVIFISAPNPNPIDEALLKQYGSCEFIGIEGFANAVSTQKGTFAPPVTTHRFTNFIYEYKQQLKPESISFPQISSFYCKGEFIRSLMQKKHGEYQYVIMRMAVDAVLRDYPNKEVFLALSDLGNGKTMFCELIRNELREHEVDVFIFNKANQNLSTEAEQISSIRNRRCVVIIDNYKNKLDVLSAFKYLDKRNITFILTARKSLNPSYHTLTSSLGVQQSDIRPIYLDVLHSQDVRSLRSVIQTNKLYFKVLTESDSIEEYIQEHCHSHFADFLLDAYQSSDIEQRIIEAWNNFSGSSMQIQHLAVLALMKSVMGIDFNFTEMLNLLKIDFVLLTAKDNIFIREFFNLDDDDVTVKSSVVARELLRSVIGIKNLIETMKVVIEAANQIYKSNKVYLELLKNLVSHSHFRMFPRTFENANAVIDFYDNLRNLSFCQNNTFYWEQFAVASIDICDFSTAYQCIENAFAIAKKIPGFVPFHIENIKANCLIENLLFDASQGYPPSPDDAIETLVDAHECLIRHLRHPDNNVSYTFSTAVKYAKIYELYKNDFDSRGKSIFTEKKIVILNHMKEYIDDLAFQSDSQLKRWIQTLESCKFDK